MMERMECLVRLVGFVDRVRWVNRVEWHGVVELDVQELVEVMTEVQVGSVDCPCARKHGCILVHGSVRHVSSRLLHGKLRSKLRS